VLYDLHSHSILVLRNVIFHENIFPFHTSLTPHFPPTNDDFSDVTIFDFPNIAPVSTATNYTPDNAPNIDSESTIVYTARQRVSLRAKSRSRYLDQFYCGATSTISSSYSTSYPIHLFLSYDTCSPNHVSFCHNISAQVEPSSFKEASKFECWQQAMNSELDALERNKTWTLVNLPTGKKIISCRWVYRIKHKADGSIDKYKAHLMARGFTQTEGLDYDETFSPVVKITIVRLILAIVMPTLFSALILRAYPNQMGLTLAHRVPKTLNSPNTFISYTFWKSVSLILS